MRRLALAVLLIALAAPALAGGVAPEEPAPLSGETHLSPTWISPESHLEPASLAPPAACAPVPSPLVDAARGFVALRWASCEGVGAYVVFRGPSVAELVPLVKVAHAGHVDVDVRAGATYAYAVQPVGGTLGAPVVVAL